MDVIIQLIGSLGFPIAVCIWGASSFKGTIDKNTEAIIAMKEVIITLKKDGE